MDESFLAAVRAAMSSVKTPSAYDKVYKVRSPRRRIDPRSHHRHVVSTALRLPLHRIAID